jgi:periplasmic divalent cation tolerance protein
MIMLKTSADKLEALEARMRELHSYRIPEFLVIPVEQGSKIYLDWLFGTLAEHK